jgi:hypothetical protein
MGNGNIRGIQNIANWQPSPGGVDADSKKAKLFSTEAHDAPETTTANNELKRWVGSGGKPKGPFGVRGQQF